ncbi:MAG: hypothetical protein COB75_04435, partial [Idiomarina sp.]
DHRLINTRVDKNPASAGFFYGFFAPAGRSFVPAARLFVATQRLFVRSLRLRTAVCAYGAGKHKY